MNAAPSRIAPIALALVLVAAACGADDAPDSPAAVDGTTTVAPTEPSGDDERRVPTPIEIVRSASSGGTRSGGTQAETATVSAGDAVTSDVMIAPWVVEYVVGEGMPALPSDDVGYVFDPADEVTVEQVATIATALGVVGEPVAGDDGSGTSWRVGPDDGTAPSLWVFDDGQQAWSYNGAWDEGDVAPCAVSVDSEGNESDDCPEPEPPIDVPTAEEAERRANELLEAIGVARSDLVVDSYADEWFASVDVTERVDGRAPLRTWSFGFGESGVLQYASGFLADAAPVGPYPLVDIGTAIARLSEGFLGGFGGVAMPEPDLAVVDEVAPEQGAESEPAEAGDRASEEPIAEPIEEPTEEPIAEPIEEPLPDGETVVVTLVDVEPDFWWAWDADGAVWLLPAYRFIDTDGSWYVVPAVADEFLIEVDMGDVEPLPAPAPAPDEPMEEPAVAEPEQPVDPADPADPADAIAILDELVGLSIEEFTAEAAALGFDTRIVQQDGEFLIVTEDFSESRVNVIVEGPRVVAIDSIG